MTKGSKPMNFMKGACDSLRKKCVCVCDFVRKNVCVCDFVRKNVCVCVEYLSAISKNVIAWELKIFRHSYQHNIQAYTPGI